MSAVCMTAQRCWRIAIRLALLADSDSFSECDGHLMAISERLAIINILARKECCGEREVLRQGTCRQYTSERMETVDKQTNDGWWTVSGSSDERKLKNMRF
jgi:hypothetical protein